jgi:elongation factor 1 alpha-like protein
MANKFTDDDLADYDEEYYEDDYVDEEQEDDKVEYNFVDKSKEDKKPITKQASLKIEPKTKPQVTLPTLSSSIFTSNQLKKMTSLSETLQLPYPISSVFLDKCVKANGLETARQNLDNPNVPKQLDNAPSPPLVFVVIGHVDAGKSTLNAQLVKHFGTLLASPKMSPKSSPTTSIVIGGPKVKTRGIPGGKSALAWELDVGSDEREHGVTIDSKSKQLKIADRKFVAIDAPGHRDYVPSMLLGAMQADAAVLVIDACKFDSGFSRGGQTKEHVSLIRSLGIQQLVVVINKIDTIDVDDREEEIATLRVQLEDFIFEEMKFGKRHVRFVLVSALLDTNIVACKDNETLEKALLELEPKNHGPIHHSICVPIVDISGNRLSGRIECGSIRAGEKLMVLPSKQLISLSWDNAGSAACPGDYLESVEFSFLDKSIDAGSASPGGNSSTTNHLLHPGSVLVDPVFPLEKMKCVENFFARILVINDDVMPIVKGQSVTLNVHTAMTDGFISRIVGKVIDQNVVTSPIPKCLVKGDVAIVEISTRKIIPIEPDVTTRVTGRVVIRDRGTTIAAGLVVTYP